MCSTSATAIELRGAFRWLLSISAIRVSGLAGSAANIDNLMRMLLKPGCNPGRESRKSATVLLPGFRFAPSGLRGCCGPDYIRGGN